MCEIHFYHLQQRPLASVLLELLRRGLQRGLRMVVETAQQEQVEKLSALLWSHDEVAFLPHGHGNEAAGVQPIWLCADVANPNQASYRFYVEGALPTSVEGLDRALILIDSNSEEALVNARNEWKKRKSENQTIKYWKQNEAGQWENLA